MNNSNQDKLGHILSKKFNDFSIINLYGESGTGKTTLALQLISNFIIKNRNNQKSCIWIQASESFPKRRLFSMYSKCNDGKLEYLERMILIYPKVKIKNFLHQNDSIKKLIDSDLLPYGLKIIVIDNISHYLRFELSKYTNIQIRQNLQDEFFESIIAPLIFFCENQGVKLIFIHEVSYNPKKDKNVMFNSKLFSRINALNIELFKRKNTGENILNLSCKGFLEAFKYEIQQIGFV